MQENYCRNLKNQYSRVLHYCPCHKNQFSQQSTKRERMNIDNWCIPFVGIAPISISVSQKLWDVWSYLALTDAGCDGLSPEGYGDVRPYESPLDRKIWREEIARVFFLFLFLCITVSPGFFLFLERENVKQSEEIARIF